MSQRSNLFNLRCIAVLIHTYIGFFSLFCTSRFLCDHSIIPLMFFYCTTYLTFLSLVCCFPIMCHSNVIRLCYCWVILCSNSDHHTSCLFQSDRFCCFINLGDIRIRGSDRKGFIFCICWIKIGQIPDGYSFFLLFIHLTGIIRSGSYLPVHGKICNRCHCIFLFFSTNLTFFNIGNNIICPIRFFCYTKYFPCMRFFSDRFFFFFMTCATDINPFSLFTTGGFFHHIPFCPGMPCFWDGLSCLYFCTTVCTISISAIPVYCTSRFFGTSNLRVLVTSLTYRFCVTISTPAAGICSYAIFATCWLFCNRRGIRMS